MMKAVFRKLFKSSNKDKVAVAGTNNSNKEQDGKNNKNVNDSPSKRIKCSTIAPNNSSKSKLPIVPKIDTTIRAKRLMKEFRELQKSKNDRNEKFFSAELINDNLFEWHVRLYHLDPESPLAQDMEELNVPCILLHLIFPDNFPFAPPFMRVVEPRIEKGFVMEGGAICMELLTPRGWASAYTIEAILMQFAASLVKGQGRICRKTKVNKEFNRRTAEEAFRSLVKTHDKYGWITPSLSDG
ncbi:CLUMA_CG006866, isoform A [Clunio marinus]|uniref:E2 ubiquitin-conjugating enzyme n=1 Tax=Clunio marinus TaxID=568069 RepID=A0A1J1HZ70_9DIPT|nr:CLUMA_CG006866, isoform A [Clunio marinus]